MWRWIEASCPLSTPALSRPGFSARQMTTRLRTAHTRRVDVFARIATAAMHGSHLSPPAWIDALPPGQTQDFVAGEMLCRPDPASNRVFLLRSGAARICLSAEHKELTLGRLRPGSVYVTHTRAWIEALEPCRVSSWPIARLQALMAAQPDLALAALREVGMMLHHATNLIEDLAFRPVEARLARYLLLEHGDQRSAVIRLTGHTELLASLVGTTRQTLSTLLNRLIKDGVLGRPDRHHLELRDLERLRRIASLSAG